MATLPLAHFIVRSSSDLRKFRSGGIKTSYKIVW